MIIPPAVERKFRLVQPYVELVATPVRGTVQKHCEDEGFAYAGRSKTAESLSEKIETGRFRSWGEIDDLFACAIIIPTLSDEAEVLTWLQRQYLEISLRKRGATKKDPEAFRFDATRFYGSLRPELNPQASPNLLSIKFEVQIRTAFEHAWSVTTHALAYKATAVSWQNERLAAQMKAAVEQLDQLVMAYEHNAAVITEHPWEAVQGKAKINAFFNERLEARAIPTEIVPGSWGRFSDNLYSLLRASIPTNQRFTLADVDRALEVLQGQIAQTNADTFPRSLSLLQVCLGALARGGYIRGQLNRFVPLISDELRDLYPECGIVGEGFDVQQA